MRDVLGPAEPILLLLLVPVLGRAVRTQHIEPAHSAQHQAAVRPIRTRRQESRVLLKAFREQLHALPHQRDHLRAQA